jgi:hypothetical protein
MKIFGKKMPASYLLIPICLSVGLQENAIAFDTTPPKVESCTISPRQISDIDGGKVRVTIKVVSKNGLSSNVLSVLNLKNNTSNSTRQLGGFIMSRESGDEFSSTWVQDIDVKPGLMPGIYELSIFPLTDKVQNGTFFLGCPGQDVSYGVAASTPTPTPKPAQTVTPKPISSPTPLMETARSGELLQLKSQIALLQTQLVTLQSKLKKICSAKPKPKGC